MTAANINLLLNHLWLVLLVVTAGLAFGALAAFILASVTLILKLIVS